MKPKNNRFFCFLFVLFIGVCHISCKGKNNKNQVQLRQEKSEKKLDVFQLVGDYYYNDTSAAYDRRYFEFNGLNYECNYVPSFRDGLLKSVVGRFRIAGEKSADNSSAPLLPVLEKLSFGYIIQEHGELFDLVNDAIEADRRLWELRMNLEPGFRESDDAKFLKSIIENHSEYVFLSPDNKVLVDVQYTINDNSVYAIEYFYVNDWIEMKKEEIKLTASGYGSVQREYGM